MVCAKCGEKYCVCEDRMDVSMDMMDLAYEAWTSLMADKLKKEFEKTSGKRMDKLSVMIAEKFRKFWAYKMSAHDVPEDFFDEFSKDMNDIFKIDKEKL